jgi:hypothetical protein
VEMRNFCCWNQQKCVWRMSALKRWALMSFFCVCETMGVVGQCVPEICRNLIWGS